VAGLLRRDFHVHTNYSLCGHPDATPEAVVRAAHECGLEAVGISDHVVAPANFDRPRLVRERVPERVGDTRVYVGCEAEMHSPSDASISPEYAAELDFVVVSASHLHNIGPHLLVDMGLSETLDFVLELTRGALATGFTDILAHPFHAPMCRFSFGQLVGTIQDEELASLARDAAQAGVAIECNPRFVRAAPAQAARLFRHSMEAGCKLSIGSDAHHPDHIGCRGDWYATEEELRALGVSEGCLWRIEDRA
jgi:histidinol phosphatase-like PHP family hydrolase